MLLPLGALVRRAAPQDRHPGPWALPLHQVCALLLCRPAPGPCQAGEDRGVHAVTPTAPAVASLSVSLDFIFLPPSALPLILEILTRLISRTLRAFRKVGPKSVQRALLWSVFIEYLLRARRWGRG